MRSLEETTAALKSPLQVCVGILQLEQVALQVPRCAVARYSSSQTGAPPGQEAALIVSLDPGFNQTGTQDLLPT